jgi:hypothetical protein
MLLVYLQHSANTVEGQSDEKKEGHRSVLSIGECVYADKWKTLLSILVSVTEAS